MRKHIFSLKNNSLHFLLWLCWFFVAYTKILFGYTFAAPLVKTKRNQKWKILHMALETPTLCFRSYENYELKVKLWRVGARKRCICHFFETCFFTLWNFFWLICFPIGSSKAQRQTSKKRSFKHYCWSDELCYFSVL